MQKLAISKDELKRHKEYFYKNVVVNLEKMKENKKYSSRKQWKFLRLCIYYKKQLAIGKPYQLRKIQEIIECHYRNVLTKDRGFKDGIEVAFGYDKFSCINIGEEVVREAKDKVGLPKKSNYKNQDIYKYLYDYFNSINKEIGNEFKEEYQKLNEKVTKAKLVDICSSLLISSIVKNYVSVKDCPEWNPYLLQFYRKIRTCPYCNRQYITPFYSEKGKIRADMDHFYPKSKYPYFSMSLYNLVPCCKFCNSSLKGVREFELEDKTPYEISIDDMATFEYEPSHNAEVIFHIKDDEVLPYAKMFKIEEIYSAHINVAKDIREQFSKFPPLRIRDLLDTGLVSEKELYQMILGKISKKEEILDEPLSKFKRDIVKDIFGEEILKLITE